MKSPVDVAKFDAELQANRRWSPALIPHIPELIADDRGARVLIMSKLDGVFGDMAESTFRQAGGLLRRLHRAEPQTSMMDFAAAYRERLEAWLHRARPGLLSDEEIGFVAAQVQRLADFDDPAGVPCHRDWQPQNWLTASDGTVAVIDFGNARVGHWFEDFERMWWAEWRTSPELGRAFFDGYGHVLDETTRAQLRATSMVWLLTTIVWADEVDDRAFHDHARAQLRIAMDGIPDLIVRA